MLFLFAIIVIVIGVISLAVFAKRRLYPQLTASESKSLAAAERFRPLFAPGDNDRDADAEDASPISENGHDQIIEPEANGLESLASLRSAWRALPNRSNTIQLLYLAAKSENGITYLEVCDEVLQGWRLGTLADLSADDLAHVIESHFWLIPASTRTPGVNFRVKEEISGLRRLALLNK
jgi:hypothetical protein